MTQTHPDDGLSELEPQTATVRRASTRELIDALSEILVSPERKKSGLCHLDEIMRAARPRTTPMLETDHVLQDLLQFAPHETPELDTTFTCALGALFEAMIQAIFSMRRPGIYVAGWSDVEAAMPSGAAPGSSKWRADFRLGKAAIELKYRYSSSNGSTEQGRAAADLGRLGYRPVMLILRADSLQQVRMHNHGWTIVSGKDAIDYINEHCDVDFVALLREVSSRPFISARIAEWRRQMEDNLAASTVATYLNGPERVRRAVRSVVEEDAQPSQSMADIAAKAAANVLQDPGGAFRRAFPEIPPDQQAALVSQLLDLMSPRARLELAAMRAA